MPGAFEAARPVDAQALARWRQRLRSAPTPPWLHGEAARRMAERLAVIRLQPADVLDWGPRPGEDAPLLRSQYPQARIRAVQARPGDAVVAVPTQSGAAKAPGWRGWLAGIGRAKGPRPPTAESTPAAALPPGSAQLVWSAMALHAEPDPQRCFAAWHRALAVDGFLMFCTFGPGTLGGLSALYAERGWPPPMAPLVDMHDLGDMLVAAGFADPVMDQETLTLTWPNATQALAELRSLGGNAAPGRSAGLRTPRWRHALLQALQANCNRQGRVALDFEIVYGHAFKPPPRPKVASQTQVPLEDLRAMVRRAPRSPA